MSSTGVDKESLLRAEFRYYLDNQETLVEQHNGKVIVIRDCEVVSVHDSELEALTEAERSFPIGTFLIQRVSPERDDSAATLHSQVVFT